MEGGDQGDQPLDVELDLLQVGPDVVTAKRVHAADATPGLLRPTTDGSGDVEQVVGEVGEAAGRVGRAEVVGFGTLLVTRSPFLRHPSRTHKAFRADAARAVAEVHILPSVCRHSPRSPRVNRIRCRVREPSTVVGMFALC